jgi:hypothetical protein
MISFHIWLFKKLIHTLQNNVHMLSFLMDFTFGPIAQATLVNMECIFRMTYIMVRTHTYVLLKTDIIYN